MNFKFVYKICSKSEWQEVKSKGQLTGSKKDLEDGYIHFSGDDQVVGTLKKFYKNQKDLVLLKVDTLKLDHLVWGTSIRRNYVSTFIFNTRYF
ncbi:DUF952 domain-containing protein [Candidatus Pelagibacter sp.]|nr:DUF952 domain-containing protein [Candidatus Pelagibacter sp.]